MKGEQMLISEIKERIDFYQDAIYQKGYDLGRESTLEEMEQISDKLWNRGDTATGTALRDIIKRVRELDGN
jgi:hypothetical protein